MNYSATMEMIGETLIMLQKLEALLKGALILSVGSSNADQNLQNLLKRDRETLGMLLRHVSARVELPPEFETELAELLRKRNTFIHKMFMQDWYDLLSEDGRDRVFKFSMEILQHSKTAAHVFIGYSIAILEGKSPSLPSDQAEIFNQIIRRIYLTANPDFGDKTPEQYCEDFSAKVHKEIAPRLAKRSPQAP